MVKSCPRNPMKEMEESTTDNIMRAWTDCSHSERRISHIDIYLKRLLVNVSVEM